MKKNSGLIHACLLDGRGGGKFMEWKEIREEPPDNGILWVHMDYSNPQIEKWFIKKSGLNEVTVRTLLAEDTRPNVIPQKGGFVITLRGVHLQPGADPEDMVAIRIWIEEKRILSTQRRRLLSIEAICQEINEGDGPKSSLDFLIELTQKMTDRIAEVVEEISDNVDTLQVKVLSLESTELRTQLADLRRRAISIRRYLAPQREALHCLAHEKFIALSEDQKLELGEVSNHLIRILEDLDSAQQRAIVTQEELVNRITEETNNRIYMLSILAAIFLPLTFLTGLLGINVGGIPGAENTSAFLYVCLIVGVAAVIQIWILKKSKWM